MSEVAPDREQLAQELFQRNEKIIWFVLWRLNYHPDVRRLGTEDAYQEGAIGLYRAARSFDPARGKFSTHAYHLIRQAIFDAARKRSHWWPHCVKLPDDSSEECHEMGEESPPELPVEQAELKEALEQALTRLSPSHRWLLRRWAGIGMEPWSLRRMGRHLKVTGETVRNRLKKALAAIRKVMGVKEDRRENNSATSNATDSGE
jgi:RNA polymerase sigma factor (sigma-70 family)